MHHLLALNIDQLLDIHLTAYLRQQNAHVLRQHCLSIMPIPPVIQVISGQLNHAAEQDKIAEATRLQEEAYQSQLNEDQNDASHDNALTEQYNRRKVEIQRSIHSITTQSRDTDMAISRLSARLLSLHHQLDDINRQLDTLQPQHRAIHHHPTHASAHVIVQNTATHVHAPLSPQERRLLDLKCSKGDLLGSIESLSREIANLRSTVRSHDASLRLCHTQLHEISGQEINLRQREITRAERSRNPKFSIEALTQTNREKLDRDIRAKRTEMDARRVDMERIVMQKCHPAFLDTLGRDLQNNVLMQIQNCENAALLHIIAQIRRHIEDLVTLDHSRTALSQSQLHLNNQLAMHKAAESSSTRLDTENGLMSDDNVRLLEANAQLSLNSDDLLSTRNQFAKYALIATVVSGMTTALGLLFNVTLIPVIPYILAGLAGAVITGLLVTSSIAWIRAVLTQSEIDDNHSKHANNLLQIANNTREMTQLSKRQLPAIETVIQHYQQEVQDGQGRVAQAEANARGSLAEAERIAVFLPSVSLSGLGIFSAAHEDRSNPIVNSYATSALTS